MEDEDDSILSRIERAVSALQTTARELGRSPARPPDCDHELGHELGPATQMLCAWPVSAATC